MGGVVRVAGKSTGAGPQRTTTQINASVHPVGQTDT